MRVLGSTKKLTGVSGFPERWQTLWRLSVAGWESLDRRPRFPMFDTQEEESRI